MIPTKWSQEQRRLYRRARHQLLVSKMAEQYSPFDGEHNVVGDHGPKDYKSYWASLSDTERAFEILQNTEAAQFMAFWDRIEASIPKPHVAP